MYLHTYVPRYTNEFYSEFWVLGFGCWFGPALLGSMMQETLSSLHYVSIRKSGCTRAIFNLPPQRVKLFSGVLQFASNYSMSSRLPGYLDRYQKNQPPHLEPPR